MPASRPSAAWLGQFSSRLSYRQRHRPAGTRPKRTACKVPADGGAFVDSSQLKTGECNWLYVHSSPADAREQMKRPWAKRQIREKLRAKSQPARQKRPKNSFAPWVCRFAASRELFVFGLTSPALWASGSC